MLLGSKGTITVNFLLESFSLHHDMNAHSGITRGSIILELSSNKYTLVLKVDIIISFIHSLIFLASSHHQHGSFDIQTSRFSICQKHLYVSQAVLLVKV